MLAKIITSGENRALALQRMRRALRSLSVQGVTTNREFLLRVLDHLPAFIAGEVDTHFIDRHSSDLDDGASEADEQRAAIAAALAEQQTARPPAGVRARNPIGVAKQLSYAAIGRIRCGCRGGPRGLS